MQLFYLYTCTTNDRSAETIACYFVSTVSYKLTFYRCQTQAAVVGEGATDVISGAIYSVVTVRNAISCRLCGACWVEVWKKQTKQFRSIFQCLINVSQPWKEQIKT